MTHKFSGGYIVIIVLILTVTLISFLMLQQYQDLGVIQKPSVTEPDTSVNLDTGSVPNPIDKAKNIKNVLEERDRNMIDQSL